MGPVAHPLPPAVRTIAFLRHHTSLGMPHIDELAA
jgi:hypothetical protein